MPANRKAVVEAVLAQFASQIEGPADTLNDIGRRLLPHFIEAMPPEERPNWGVLEKRTSDPHSVPYDILVWKPTREHFDVLTSKALPGEDEKHNPKHLRRLQATWGTPGKLPKPTWHWCDWRHTQTPIVPLGELPEPVPDPGTPVPNPGTLEARVAKIEAWIRRVL